jgi:apolipoprotein D and lipocalin family protein
MISVQFPAAPSLRRLALGLVLLAASAAQAAPTGHEPRKPIDPDRYLGRWYEIARVPNKLQTNCEGATSDWSKTPDGQYAVVQTCRIGSPGGPTKVWKGAGHMIAPAKIRIAFFLGMVQKDYWILDRSDDYSWSIMGMADPKYVWIMSRRAVLNEGQKAALVAHARALGYDPGHLVFDQQPPAA